MWLFHYSTYHRFVKKERHPECSGCCQIVVPEHKKNALSLTIKMTSMGAKVSAEVNIIII